MGDHYLLRTLLRDLISNAWKFTRTKKHARIEFNSVTEDGRLTYYIKDNGVGFDIKYIDKLFKLFQRLHDPEEYEGTGTGLAIAKQIIDLHGGEIWAQAKEGKGATFYFML